MSRSMVLAGPSARARFSSLQVAPKLTRRLRCDARARVQESITDGSYAAQAHMGSTSRRALGDGTLAEEIIPNGAMNSLRIKCSWTMKVHDQHVNADGQSRSHLAQESLDLMAARLVAGGDNLDDRHEPVVLGGANGDAILPAH